METVKQPTKTTNRKVRWATVAAAIAAPLSYLIAAMAVASLPLPVTAGAIDALAVALEVGVSSALTAFAVWLAGYLPREEKLTPAEVEAGQ